MLAVASTSQFEGSVRSGPEGSVSSTCAKCARWPEVYLLTNSAPDAANNPTTHLPASQGFACHRTHLQRRNTKPPRPDTEGCRHNAAGLVQAMWSYSGIVAACLLVPPLLAAGVMVTVRRPAALTPASLMVGGEGRTPRASGGGAVRSKSMLYVAKFSAVELTSFKPWRQVLSVARYSLQAPGLCTAERGSLSWKQAAV